MNRFSYELDKARNSHLKKKLSDATSSSSARPSFVREPSNTEQNRIYAPPGHGLLFCTHGKSYFELCSVCKRDRRIAGLNYERFCNRHGLSK